MVITKEEKHLFFNGTDMELANLMVDTGIIPERWRDALHEGLQKSRLEIEELVKMDMDSGLEFSGQIAGIYMAGRRAMNLPRIIAQCAFDEAAAEASCKIRNIMS